MWEFIIPTLISTIGGAIQSGSAARQAERQNQMAADSAAARRTQLMDIINDIRNTDYRGLERSASAQFSEAADQIEALTAGRRTFGSGTTGARALQSQALSSMLAGLAQQKNADTLQRQQMVANLMGDQAFITPDPGAFDPNAAAMAGYLSGGAAGLASGAASFFQTDVGQDWLRGLGRSAPATPVAPAAPIPAFGVQAAPVAPAVGYQPMYVTPRPPMAGPVASGPATPPGWFNPTPPRAPVQPIVRPWFQTVAR